MSTISPLGTPSSWPAAPITTEEFNAFHGIDRALYALLIFALGRDPSESMWVMGLLLWLERDGRDSHLVHSMLSMETSLVNLVAEESGVCLKCVESDFFQFNPPHGNDLPLLRSLLGGRDLSLRFFHENRVSVLCGVTNIVSEVCARAFEDILVRHVWGYPSPLFAGSSSSCGGVPPLVVAGGGDASGDLSAMGVPNYPPPGGAVLVSHLGSSTGLTGNAATTAPFRATPPPPPTHQWVSSEENIGVCNDDLMVPKGGVLMAVQGYDGNYKGDHVNDQQRRFLKEEMDPELFGSLSLQQGGGEGTQVPPDDRTIFLTFSKGYPISENELRDFFTWKFGEILEAIEMQEVGASEQVLYAKLVARSASSIEVVLGGQKKARFSINGKHVWARKYIKNHHKSPLLLTATRSKSNYY